MDTEEAMQMMSFLFAESSCPKAIGWWTILSTKEEGGYSRPYIFSSLLWKLF